MAFSDLVANIDATCLSVFADGITVTIHPQDGSPDVVTQYITKDPRMEDDYVPGSQQGTAVLLLFIRFNGLTPLPARGDTATVNAVDYDIFQVDPDREGGAVMRLRRRTQRWDQ
jgi:hypothetical protein